MRDGAIGGAPAELAMAHVGAVLDDYHAATSPTREATMLRLGRDEDELQALGALWTAREIAQQPAMLRETHAALVAAQGTRSRLPVGRSWIAPQLRMILTGAGTSAFIGECLAPYLAARLRAPGRGDRHHRSRLRAAISISSQTRRRCWFRSARSGNSPESVAALELADRFVDEIHHLAITCNPEGALARKIAQRGDGMAVLLPEATHDRSFAMTSSFSCMTYAALAAFCPASTAWQARVERVARAVEAVIAAQADAMQDARRTGATSAWSISAAISSRGLRARPRSSCWN